eukprot:6121923-Alexandrium_andersonii.AAC.1
MAASGSHAWEKRSSHAWEQDDDGVERGSDSESDAEQLGPEEAGRRFVETPLSLYFDGRLSAKILCVLCFWAAKSGATGPARDFAHRPDDQFGRRQRKLDGALGVEMGRT